MEYPPTVVHIAIVSASIASVFLLGLVLYVPVFALIIDPYAHAIAKDLKLMTWIPFDYIVGRRFFKFMVPFVLWCGTGELFDARVRPPVFKEYLGLITELERDEWKRAGTLRFDRRLCRYYEFQLCFRPRPGKIARLNYFGEHLLSPTPPI